MRRRIVENTTARTFANEIRAAITEELLVRQQESVSQHILPLPFDYEWIQYYVPRRQYPDVTAPEAYECERRFHLLYWPTSATANAQLIIVKGREGIGKSTFLQHYFRYYLPYLPRLRHPRSLIQNNEAEWSRLYASHIVLYVDLRRATEPRDVFPLIYDTCRDQLLERFGPGGDSLNAWRGGDLRSCDCYAMWDRAVGGWNSDYHKDRRGGVPLHKYRSDHLGERDLWRNSQEFVTNAIQYLARLTTAEGGRRFYVSAVFDNADQMTEMAQLELVRFAQRNVYQSLPKAGTTEPVGDDRFAYWRVIVPIRPETYERLQNDLDPFDNKEVFEVRGTDQRMLLESRSKLLEALVAATNRYVQELVPHLDSRTCVQPMPKLKLMSSEAAAVRLRNWFGVGIQEEDLDAETGSDARRVFHDLVDGSSRRFLKLRGRLSTSRVVRTRLAQARKSRWEGPKLSPFYFFEGLLCGAKGVFEQSDEDNLVLNMFELGTSVRDAYSLLVGPIVIWLMAKQGVPYETAEHRLKVVGFSSEDTQYCCSWLVQKQLLKPTRPGEGGDMLYYREKGVVAAHCALLEERAYIDNAAIAYVRVTAKTEEERDGAVTDALDYADFVARLTVSLRFMNAIRKAQECVCNVDSAHGRHGLGEDEFRQKFDSFRFPDVYRLMGCSYSARVGALLQSETTLWRYLRRQRQLSQAEEVIDAFPEGVFDPERDYLAATYGGGGERAETE